MVLIKAVSFSKNRRTGHRNVVLNPMSRVRGGNLRGENRRIAVQQRAEGSGARLQRGEKRRSSGSGGRKQRLKRGGKEDLTAVRINEEMVITEKFSS